MLAPFAPNWRLPKKVSNVFDRNIDASVDWLTLAFAWVRADCKTSPVAVACAVIAVALSLKRAAYLKKNNLKPLMDGKAMTKEIWVKISISKTEI